MATTTQAGTRDSLHRDKLDGASLRLSLVLYDFSEDLGLPFKSRWPESSQKLYRLPGGVIELVKKKIGRSRNTGQL